MPKKPDRPCGHPVCSNMAQPKKKYCEQCEKMYEYSKPEILKKKRVSVCKRGYDSRWRKVRKMFLNRFPLCSDKNCNQFASEVDHIKPLSAGGTNEFDNLQGFCKRHHSIKTVMFDGGFGHIKKKYKAKTILTGQRKKNPSNWSQYRMKEKGIKNVKL